jgi:hypothetical protein
MKHAPSDEPIQDADDDLAADKRGGAPSTDDDEQSSIKREHNPDNDGETVEE